MTGEANAGDPVPFEDAGLQQLDGGIEFSKRLRRAPAQHQHVGDAGFRKPGNAIGQIARVLDEAGGHVRHGVKTMGGDRPGSGDLGRCVGGIDEGDEDLRSRRQPRRDQRKLVSLPGGDLQRQPAEEVFERHGGDV